MTSTIVLKDVQMTTATAKSRSTGKKVSSGVNDTLPEFVSCELEDEQKKYVKAHMPEFSECVDNLDRLIRDGYKFSFRYEEKSLAVAVWLTGPSKESDNTGLVLAARGPSLHACLGVLFYKHFEVLAEDWRTAGVIGSKRDNWG